MGTEATATEVARARVIEIVEALPEGRAVAQGTHLSLQVGKKRFAWFLVDHHGDGRISIHCKATEAGRAKLARQMAMQAHVPKYVGQRGWLGLWLDTPNVDWSRVRAALLDAYRLTAPKRLVARLDAGSDV